MPLQRKSVGISVVVALAAVISLVGYEVGNSVTTPFGQSFDYTQLRALVIEESWHINSISSIPSFLVFLIIS